MGIFKVLFFGNGKKRSKKKVLDLRPRQFVFRFTWENIPIFLKKHVGLVAVILLLLGVGFFTVRPFFIKASVAVFYPTNCLGGWENVHNAEGEPQVSGSDPSLFNEQNSAYLNNRISQIYCGNFTGTLPQNTEPQKIILHLSWAVGNKDAVAETTVSANATSTAASTDTVHIDLDDDFTSSALNAQNPSLNSSSTDSTSTMPTSSTSTETPASAETPASIETPTPAETPAPTEVPAPVDETPTPVEVSAPADQSPPTPAVPVETPASVETPPAPVETPPAPAEAPAPTSFLNFLFPKVYADDLINQTSTPLGTTTVSETTTTDQTATTSPTPVAPAEDPIFTILYTLDGTKWNTLGTVTQSEIGAKDFEIPIDNIQSQADLSNIQINIQSATTLDQDLSVYLDGMSLAVRYANASKALQFDADKNMVADIYDQVQTQDNSWALLTDRQYVRVTFDSVLDNTDSGMIYARPINSKRPATIEIYPVYTDADGNTTEGSKVAVFNNIDRENTYRVLLTKLQVPTDVFDFKIIGDVGIDYIADPTILANFVSDQQLANIPESEFLNKFSNLKQGFGELTYDITTDKPVFQLKNRKNSFNSQTNSSSTDSSSTDSVTDYKIKKTVQDSENAIATNYETSGIKVKTEYKESDGISMATGNKPIKQTITLDNTNSEDTNFTFDLKQKIDADYIS